MYLSQCMHINLKWPAYNLLKIKKNKVGGFFFLFLFWVDFYPSHIIFDQNSQIVFACFLFFLFHFFS